MLFLYFGFIEATARFSFPGFDRFRSIHCSRSFEESLFRLSLIILPILKFISSFARTDLLRVSYAATSLLFKHLELDVANAFLSVRDSVFTLKQQRN